MDKDESLAWLSKVFTLWLLFRWIFVSWRSQHWTLSSSLTQGLSVYWPLCVWNILCLSVCLSVTHTHSTFTCTNFTSTPLWSLHWMVTSWDNVPLPSWQGLLHSSGMWSHACAWPCKSCHFAQREGTTGFCSVLYIWCLAQGPAQIKCSINICWVNNWRILKALWGGPITYYLLQFISYNCLLQLISVFKRATWGVCGQVGPHDMIPLLKTLHWLSHRLRVTA